MLSFLLTPATKAWGCPANIRWNPYADKLYQMLWGQAWGFYTAQRFWRLPALSQNMDPWQHLKQHRVHRAKVCLDGCCFPGVASGTVVLSWSSVMQTMDLCVCLTAVITYGINIGLPWLSIRRVTEKVVHNVSGLYTILVHRLLGYSSIWCIQANPLAINQFSREWASSDDRSS